MSIAFQQNIYTYQHILPYVPHSEVPYQLAVQQMTAGQTMAFRNQAYTPDVKGQAYNTRDLEMSTRKSSSSLITFPSYTPMENTCSMYQGKEQQFGNNGFNVKTEPGITAELPSSIDTVRTSHPRLCLPNISASDNFAENVMSEESDLGYYSFCDIGDVKFDDIPTEEDDSKANFSNIIDEVLDSLDANITSEIETDVDKVKVKPFQTNTISYLPCAYQNVILNIPTPSQPQIQNQYTRTYFPERAEYICSLCDKPFKTKLELATHTRNHKNSRPHKCSYCAKSFTQKSTLRTHERTHTGEKPYCCQYCSRAFSDYSTFRKHLRTHTGEKPYICDVCSKSFTQSGNMIRHREIHFKHLKNV